MSAARILGRRKAYWSAMSGSLRFTYEVLAVHSASQRTTRTALTYNIFYTFQPCLEFQPSIVFREGARDWSKIIPMTQLVSRLSSGFTTRSATY